MQEKSIEIEHVNPVEIFGINNAKLNLVSSYFPKLKLVARGNTIKIIGEEEQVNEFELKLNQLLEHYQKYSSLSEGEIERLLQEEGMPETSLEAGDVLVHGTNGNIIKARTANQRKMVDAINESDMLFAVGPAGSGKTYTAVAIAVKALKEKEVRKIILTRPAVEAGEHLGFLPGDLKEKLDPYLQPLYDALGDMIPAEKLASHLEKGIIQIAPLAFMRGRTLDNAFVILDEAQNATKSQMKMFLTRMGKRAKFIITGDTTQIDLPIRSQSGLLHTLTILKKIKGISLVTLDAQDVIRHKLVRSIINAYEKYEEEINKNKKDE